MSEFIEWSDELSVGIEEIDEQHKVLVGIVNEMHDAIHEHKGAQVTGDILQRLREYTVIHFAVEESLMRIFDYPDYEHHKASHQYLIEQIHALQEKVATGKHSISFELMHFLRIWLTKHIMEEDKKYEKHFLERGVMAQSAKKTWFGRLWGHLHN